MRKKSLILFFVIFFVIVLFAYVIFFRYGKISGFSVFNSDVFFGEVPATSSKVVNTNGETTFVKDKTSQEQTCLENWECGEWSACLGVFKTRNCVDKNSCGTELNKPVEKISCADFKNVPATEKREETQRENVVNPRAKEDELLQKFCTIKNIKWADKDGNKIEKTKSGEIVYLSFEVSSKCIGKNAEIKIYEDDVFSKDEVDSFKKVVQSEKVRIAYEPRKSSDFSGWGFFGEDELVFHVLIEEGDSNILFSNLEGYSEILIVEEGEEGGGLILAQCSNGICEEGETFGNCPSDCTDADRDGLADWWEFKYFGNLNFNGQNDNDNDGFTNEQEYYFGTNPTTKDENIIKNPSFEQGTTYWGVDNGGEGGSIQVVDGGINGKVLLIDCPGASKSCHAYQYFANGNQPTTQLYIGYWIKPVKKEGTSLTALGVFETFPTNPKLTSYNYGSFNVKVKNPPQWEKKEFIVTPIMEPESVTVDLLNDIGGSSTTYYDELLILKLPEEITEFKTQNAVLKITSNAHVKSLVYNGQEQLKFSKPLSLITFEDGERTESHRFVPLENNKYRVYFFNSSVELTLEITPFEKYIRFKVLEIYNPSNEQIYNIEFNFEVNHSPQLEKEWALNAPSNELFLNFIGLNVQTYCDIGLIRWGQPYDYANYRCYANKGLGMEDMSFVLMTSQKSEYNQVMRKIAQDNGIYDVVLSDGKWLRDSLQLRESYVLAAVNKDNYQKLLKYLTIGKFKQLTVEEGLKYGFYNETWQDRFNTHQDFINAMNAFKQSGIKVGFHTQLNLVGHGYGLDFSNPPVPLSQAIYTIELGKLASPMGTEDLIIEVDRNITQNEDFSYLYYESWDRWGNVFMVDNELINCNFFTISPTKTTINCNKRGDFSTIKTSHNIGSSVYYAPQVYRWWFFFINPNYQPLVEASTSGFASIVKELDAQMLYVDGAPFVDKKDTWGNRHKYGVLPYFDKLERIPLVQFGEGSPSIGWFYERRQASDDGFVFKNKQNTREHKLPMWTEEWYTPWNSFYGKMIKEFGWWKFHGAEFSLGKYDFDAVTFDDLYYVMTKTIAYDSSLGLQLSSFYDRHERLSELFGVIGMYHELMSEDISKRIVPKHIKEYLQKPENEAELNKIAGYNFVEKRVDMKYAIWSSTAPFSYSFENPFAEQKLKLEIRPKFDYYGFSSPYNYNIYTFLATPNNEKSELNVESINGASCDLKKDGTLNVTNNGNSPAACKISIPELPNQNYDLRFKRGIGLSLTGSSNKELVIVKLHHTSYGSRDFKFYVDFSGKKELILGDPTGDENDYDSSGIKINWPVWDETRTRRWDFNYGVVNQIKMLVAIPAKSSSTIRLHELKALGEKGQSAVANPTLTINGQKIKIPTTLYVDDVLLNILEYDGYSGNIKLYNSNHKLLETKSLPSDVKLKKGINNIEISSDTNPIYSTRADVRISVYDDEDNDGIPTNGNYLGSYEPCNGIKNFCDDNCPLKANSNQKDSDNDGIGDACDSSGYSGGGNGGVGGNKEGGDNKKACVVEWRCTEWGVCIKGVQRRTCFDANACNITDGKPFEIRECSGWFKNKILNGGEDQITPAVEDFIGMLKEKLNKVFRSDKFKPYLISLIAYVVLLLFILIVVSIKYLHQRKIEQGKQRVSEENDLV